MKATIGIILAIAIAAGVSYCTGRRDGRAAAETPALQRSIDSSLAVRAAVVETILVHAPAVAAAAAESERYARIVTIAGPTSLAVRLTPTSPATLVPVPPEVVGRIRRDSITRALQAAQLLRYQLLAREDSNTIRLQELRIAELERGRRCGPKCGAAIVVSSIIAIGAAVKYGDELLGVIIPGQRPRPATSVSLVTLRGL